MLLYLFFKFLIFNEIKLFLYNVIFHKTIITKKLEKENEQLYQHLAMQNDEIRLDMFVSFVENYFKKLSIVLFYFTLRFDFVYLFSRVFFFCYTSLWLCLSKFTKDF